MDEESVEPIKETLNDMNSNLQRKRYALQVLDSEYKKICHKAQSNMRVIEELASRMYNLESYLKSAECRLEEYSIKEKEWEKEAALLNKNLDELKKQFEEEKNAAEAEDTKFDVMIVKMVEDWRKHREFYDNSNTEEQTENIQEIKGNIVQEISDIKQTLAELKLNFPLRPSEEDAWLLKNINLRDFLEPEIKALENKRDEHLEKLTSSKREINSIEEEIKWLSSQL